MNYRTLIAMEAITLPIGLSALDLGRALLLALLVLLSFGLLVWARHVSKEYVRRQTSQRLALTALARARTDRAAARDQAMGEA